MKPATAAAAAAAAATKHHVLFVGASQKSHIIHMQGLAEELVARGHVVTFAALESDRSVVTSTEKGVTFLSAGEPEHDAAYYGYTHNGLDLFRLCADYSVHLYESLLPKLLQNNKTVDLVVFDNLFWLAGHALARDLSTKAVMLYPGLFGVGDWGMEPDYVPAIISGFQSTEVRGIRNLVKRIQNFAMLRLIRYGLGLLKHRIFRPALQKLNVTNNPYGKTRLALHGSFFGLGEVSRVQPTLANPMVQLTGPWLPRSTTSSLHESEVKARFHHTSGPIVFVAIGTNAYWTEEIIDAMVDCLLEFNQTKELRVLWSMKDRDVINSLEPALQKRLKLTTEDHAVDLLADTLMVVPFVDQLDVLQWDSVAAFVSHCGFGSMQEALYTGKPVLAMPMMIPSDQVTIAARLVELGVAESFDSSKDEITSTAMLQKLRALTASPENNSYLFRAHELKRISHMLQGPKRAADWLEIEMEVGTQFMVGIEEELTWVDHYSLDVYAALTLVALAVKAGVKALLR